VRSAYVVRNVTFAFFGTVSRFKHLVAKRADLVAERASKLLVAEKADLVAKRA
jgi:hypothetical protein